MKIKFPERVLYKFVNELVQGELKDADAVEIFDYFWYGHNMNKDESVIEKLAEKAVEVQNAYRKM